MYGGGDMYGGGEYGDNMYGGGYGRGQSGQNFGSAAGRLFANKAKSTY